MSEDDIISYILRAPCRETLLEYLNIEDVYHLRLTSTPISMYIGNVYIGRRVAREWFPLRALRVIKHMDIGALMELLRRFPDLTLPSFREFRMAISSMIIARAIMNRDKKVYDSAFDMPSAITLASEIRDPIFEVFSSPPYVPISILACFIRNIREYDLFMHLCNCNLSLIRAKIISYGKYTPKDLGAVFLCYTAESLRQAIKIGATTANITDAIKYIAHEQDSITTSWNISSYIYVLLRGGFDEALEIFLSAFHDRIEWKYVLPDIFSFSNLYQCADSAQQLNHQLGHFITEPMKVAVDVMLKRRISVPDEIKVAVDNIILRRIKEYGDGIDRRILDTIFQYGYERGRIEKFRRALLDSSSRWHLQYRLMLVWRIYVDYDTRFAIAATSWPLKEIKWLDWLSVRKKDVVMGRALGFHKDDRVSLYLSRQIRNRKGYEHTNMGCRVLRKTGNGKKFVRGLRRYFALWDSTIPMNSALKEKILRMIFDGNRFDSFQLDSGLVRRACRSCLHYIPEDDPAWNQKFTGRLTNDKDVHWINKHLRFPRFAYIAKRHAYCCRS